MKVGYCRVSSEDQNLERQLVAMEEKGVEKIFQEKISGKNTERPELKKMIDFVREGDTVYIESYSRLARSSMDLLSLVNTLAEKQVSVVSLKENLDTSTPMGRLILTFIAGLVQFERECTLERQREGIAIAKAAGKYKGKPKMTLPPNFAEMVRSWRQGLITAKKAQQLTGMKASTFYKYEKLIEK